MGDFAFTIVKKKKRKAYRVGVLKTPHGNIETPALIKTVDITNLVWQIRKAI